MHNFFFFFTLMKFVLFCSLFVYHQKISMQQKIGERFLSINKTTRAVEG